MRDGLCRMDPDHKGRHTTVAYYCDGCGQMRRSHPVAHYYDINGDIDASLCFMCVTVPTRGNG
jgi:hypothetical protein